MGYGKQQGSQREAGQTQSAAASHITAGTGDVTLGARDQVSVTGSHIDAGRDFNAQAKVIEVAPGHDSIDAQSEHERRQAGVTFSANNPIVSAVQTSIDMRKAAVESDDPRMKALAATAAGLAMANAYSAVARNPASAGGVSFNVDVGVSSSRQRQESSTSAVASSTVQAGRDINFKASGEGSRILVEGSQITAARNAVLQSDGDLLLKAAATTQQTNSKQSSSSASVGVGFAIGGTQNGFTINVAASTARGNAEGNSVTWTPSTVQAGGVALMESGGDTGVLGSQVRAPRIVANVGGDMTVESLQDTAEYTSEQSSGGVGLSLCLPPICYGVSSASGHVGGGEVKSAYASVTQQAGLMAGDGGFQVYVNRETSLVGGVMSSSARAVAEGLNYLDTGTLITRNVENKAWYTGSQFALGGGFSFGGDAGDKKAGDAAGESQAGQKPSSAVGTDNQGNAASGTRAVPGSTLPSFKGVSVAPPGVAQAREEVESITYSAISGGTIRIRDLDGQRARTGLTADQIIAGLNRDTQDTLNSLDPIFDRKKVQAGLDIAIEASQQAGTYFANKARDADEIKQALDKTPEGPQRDALAAQYAEVSKWGPGGGYRRVLTAILVGVSGNVAAGGGETLQAATVAYLQSHAATGVKQIADALGDGPQAETARAAVHAIVGCAGAAASQANCGAAALGASAGSILNSLGDEIRRREAANGPSGATPGPDGKSLTASEKEAWRNTVTTLVLGIATALGSNPVSAVTAASIETENNYLNAPEIRELVAAKRRGSQCRDAECRAAEQATLNAVATSNEDRNSRLEALPGDKEAYSAQLSEIEKDIAGLTELAKSENTEEANAARSQMTQATNKYRTVLYAQKELAISLDGVVRAEQMVGPGYLSEQQGRILKSDPWNVVGDIGSAVIAASPGIGAVKGATSAAKSSEVVRKVGKDAKSEGGAAFSKPSTNSLASTQSTERSASVPAYGGNTQTSGSIATGSKISLGAKEAKSAVEAPSIFTQQRNFWSKEPIQFRGNKVYQRNDLFDPNLKTTWREDGKAIRGTNIERMASGRAPIGVDGKPVNLHHMTQTQSGPIAEMTQTFHQSKTKIIHVNPSAIPSGIDRVAFDRWKARYWQQRSAEFRN